MQVISGMVSTYMGDICDIPPQFPIHLFGQPDGSNFDSRYGKRTDVDAASLRIVTYRPSSQ